VTVSRATSSIVSNALRRRRVGLGAQPPQAGVHEDHVDRVAGGVVQVAGDPGALLGGRQPALALGALAAGARALADQPGRPPDEDAEDALGPGDPVVRHAVRGDVGDQDPDGDGGHLPRPRARPVGLGDHEVEGEGRPQRRAFRVRDETQRGAGEARDHEHGQRPPAAGGERQRRGRREQDRDRVDVHATGLGVAAQGEQRQRPREHRERDARIDQPVVPWRHAWRG
jgi:hypothetical protein